MADKKEPNIWRPKWKSGCKNCGPSGGGGGDPNTGLGLLFLAFLLSPPLIYGLYLLCNAHGLSLDTNECAWNSDERAYMASARLHNSESTFKVVSVRIQGRFKPPAGERWPDPSIQVQYEAVSDYQVVEVEPNGEGTVSTRFAIPGAERFDCRAEASVVGQRTFQERPSSDVLNAIRRSL